MCCVCAGWRQWGEGDRVAHPGLELMRELQDGADFAQLAAKFSICPSGKRAGGSLGSFTRGRMVPAFDAVIFDPNSKVGDVLGPIQTRFGWHLIQIHSREEPIA
jgi:peptidyl-prolyl cis-trans isomerase C